MEALKKRREISEQEKSVVPKEKVRKPSHQPSPQPKPAPKTQIRRPDNREERLAALRAKSAATAQFAKEAKDAKKVESKEEMKTDLIETPKVELVAKEIEKVEIETIVPEAAGIKKSSNVFKTIKTEIKKGIRNQSVDVVLIRKVEEGNLNPKIGPQEVFGIQVCCKGFTR